MAQSQIAAHPKAMGRGEKIVALVSTFFLLLMFVAALFPNRHGKEQRRIAAQMDAYQLSTAIKEHYFNYESAPRGSNAEIISALRGANPGKVNFFEFPQSRESPTGEFLDPWGMPYRINTSDPAKPRIYSFGPNQHDDSEAEGSDDIVNWR